MGSGSRFYWVDEDADGNRHMEEAVRVPRLGSDEPVIHLGSSKHQITFKPGTPKEMQEEVIGAVAKAGGEVRHRYTTVLLGFAGSITDAHVAALEADDYVVIDGLFPRVDELRQAR